jgi:hypothetical protein
MTDDVGPTKDDSIVDVPVTPRFASVRSYADRSGDFACIEAVMPLGHVCYISALGEKTIMRIALVLAATLLASSVGASEFASAPLDKPTKPICIHDTCATLRLISVVPMENETSKGILYSVVFAYDYFDKSRIVFNSFIYCSKSNPATLNYSPEGWELDYLHPASTNLTGPEESSLHMYFATCHATLKYDADHGSNLGSRLGYSPNLNQSTEGGLKISPYEFMATENARH